MGLSTALDTPLSHEDLPGLCPPSFLTYPATPWSGTLRNSVLCSEGGRARGRLLAPRVEDGGPRGGLWELLPDVIDQINYKNKVHLSHVSGLRLWLPPCGCLLALSVPWNYRISHHEA